MTEADEECVPPVSLPHRPYGTTSPATTAFAMVFPAATLALAACNPPGLDIDSEGLISFDNALPAPSRDVRAEGRFVIERGCRVFEIADGSLVIPIMPGGQVFLVEDASPAARWVLLGVDRDTPVELNLAADPVARRCNAVPVFVQDIVPAGEPPLPPSG